MRRIRPFFCLLLFSLSAHTLCPPADTLIKAVNPSVIVSLVSGQDDSCVCKLLSVRFPKKSLDSLEKAIEIHAGKTPFTLKMLQCLGKNESVTTDQARWVRLTGIWEKKNGPHNETAQRLIDDGNFAGADTFFTLFDRAGRLDVYDLLQWAKVKNILGSLDGAARMFCRVCAGDNHLAPITFSQFTRMFEDIPGDSAQQVLKEFRKCILSSKHADTVTLRNWLADMYCRLGLLDDEVEVLVTLDLPGSSTARRLLDAARDRFLHRRYKLALIPAILAYGRLNRPDLKAMAATVIYQSYIETNRKDSAIVWLGRADLTDDNRKADAVVLYQSTGHLKKALDIIETMPRGVMRDSLVVRQFLFSGDPEKAAEIALHPETYWARYNSENSLWKVRTLLFSNNRNGLTAFFDSITVTPSQAGAGEIIQYRYYFQRFRDSDGAFEAWAQSEYNFFLGNSRKALEQVALKSLDTLSGRLLVLRIARMFLERGNSKDALVALDYYTNEKSAEYMYYKSEAFFRNGDVEKARDMLQKLLLDFPGDVFSSKARILLSQIQPKS